MREAPSPPDENWSEADEATFYANARTLGWSPALVQDLVRDYAKAVQGTMGEVTEDMVAELNKRYEGRLTSEERAALVSWVKGSSS